MLLPARRRRTQLRRLKSTYTGPGIRLRRASDNAEQDINFLGFTGFTGAPIDMAAANAHCAATSCFAAKIYDQSGNGRDAVQATPGSQPAYVANCLGALPCLHFTATAQELVSPSVPSAVKSSFSAVADRISGTGICVFARKGSNQLVTFTSANTWQVSDGVVAAFTMPAADNAWHAGIGVIDAAASLGRVDGTEMPGSAVPGQATAGTMKVAGFDGSVCRVAESVVWDNYALTQPERAALTANQSGFWGF